jgi:hypothetical protein
MHYVKSYSNAHALYQELPSFILNTDVIVQKLQTCARSGVTKHAQGKELRTWRSGVTNIHLVRSYKQTYTK